MASTDIAPLMINDRLYRPIQEGKARILAPYTKPALDHSAKKAKSCVQPRNNDEGDQAVFYNPIQQYNRDLSVLAILVYGESAIAFKKRKYVSSSQAKKQKKRKLARAEPACGQPNPNTGPPTPPEESVVKTRVDNGSASESADYCERIVDGESRKRSSDVAGLTPCEHTNDRASKVAKLSNETSDLSRSDEQVQDSTKSSALASLQESNSISQATAAKASNTLSNQIHQREYKQPSFSILDALSASGLRAIRYAKEIPFATHIVANDMLADAVDSINLNIEHNSVADRVFSNVGDARQYMYSKCGDEKRGGGPGYVHRFDVIDLDPYGTAAPFLDAALQAISNGGMLCVTCTDAAVWASNGYPEKAFALYGGVPLKGTHSHEAGLRLILHSIATTASKYGLAIEPLLSLSIDFYGRLFLRVHRQQAEVKLLAGTTMVIHNCDQGCGAWEKQLIARNQVQTAKNGEHFFKHSFAQAPRGDVFCKHCGSKMHLGGPMWAGPIHNPVFVQMILDKLPDLDKTIYGTTDRIKGMLNVALEEEHLDWDDKDANLANSEPTSKDINGVTPTRKNEDILRIIPRMPPHLLSPSPLFFQPTYLAKVLSIPTPAEDPFRGAILGLGYTCTRSHCKPGSFKTNAPWHVLWEITREYARQCHPDSISRLLGEGEHENKGRISRGSPGWKILRRLRGRKGETMRASLIKETLREKLGYGSKSAEIDSVNELKDVLQAALFQLEHPLIEDKSEEKDSQVETNGSSGSLPSQRPMISGKALIDIGGDVSELKIVFDADVGKKWREAGGTKLVRYQINPRANWGPMNRAGGGS